MSGNDAPGWVALPWPSAPRWWLPRGRATVGSLAVYHPVTARARVGWRLAQGFTRLGAHRLLRSGEPLQAVQDIVAPDMPASGSLAVMRANHAGRFVALLMDAAGRPARVAKVALAEPGKTAVDREAAALSDFAGRLQAPVAAPTLIAHRPGVLVTVAVPWRVRRYPWLMPISVAASLGALFRSAQSSSGPTMGAAHGDCAPWNLLWTGTDWTLVDWEAAEEQAPPLTDIFHFVVQAHALLKRPRLTTVLAGLDGHGWVGHAIRVYSEAAAIATGAAIELFRAYLATSMETLDSNTPDGRAGWRARQRLLEALPGRASR
jgi:hypothetical protein